MALIRQNLFRFRLHAPRWTRRRVIEVVGLILTALGVIGTWLALSSGKSGSPAPPAPNRVATSDSTKTPLSGFWVFNLTHRSTDWAVDLAADPGDHLVFSVCLCAAEKVSADSFVVQISRLDVAKSSPADALHVGFGALGGREAAGRDILVRRRDGRRAIVTIDRTTFRLIDKTGATLAALKPTRPLQSSLATLLPIAAYEVGPLATGEKAWVEFNGTLGKVPPPTSAPPLSKPAAAIAVFSPSL